jgi:transcriptional regulator with XRE-family HTH domain
MSKLGTFLAAARKKKNLTLRAVEKATGISNAYLSQIETGDVREPSPTMLVKLSELYEVPTTMTLAYAGYPVPGIANTDGAASIASRIGRITEEEEVALLEYLDFLRTKRERGARR